MKLEHELAYLKNMSYCVYETFKAKRIKGRYLLLSSKGSIGFTMDGSLGKSIDYKAEPFDNLGKKVKKLRKEMKAIEPPYKGIIPIHIYDFLATKRLEKSGFSSERKFKCVRKETNNTYSVYEPKKN